MATPSYVLLEKITVGAAGASSVTFTGIPQTGYTDLVVKVYDELPKMVKILESSYGAKTVERKTRKEVMVGINDILK